MATVNNKSSQTTQDPKTAEVTEKTKETSETVSDEVTEMPSETQTEAPTKETAAEPTEASVETSEEVVEEPTEKTEEPKETTPVTKPESKQSAKTETKASAKSTDAYSAGKCYTFVRATNVHTEPDVNSLTIGVRSITESVVAEAIHEANGYIWAEYHSSPKHVRFVALATSDGSETFVK